MCSACMIDILSLNYNSDGWPRYVNAADTRHPPPRNRAISEVDRISRLGDVGNRYHCEVIKHTRLCGMFGWKRVVGGNLEWYWRPWWGRWYILCPWNVWCQLLLRTTYCTKPRELEFRVSWPRRVEFVR